MSRDNKEDKLALIVQCVHRKMKSARAELGDESLDELLMENNRKDFSFVACVFGTCNEQPRVQPRVEQTICASAPEQGVWA
jgi:hypothetical protein